MAMTIEELTPSLRGKIHEFHSRGFPNAKIAAWFGVAAPGVGLVLGGTPRASAPAPKTQHSATPAHARRASGTPQPEPRRRLADCMRERLENQGRVSERLSHNPAVKACERLAAEQATGGSQSGDAALSGNPVVKACEKLAGSTRLADRMRMRLIQQGRLPAQG